ncbi:hypothetical protein [Gloeothece verrucosa]|uniref:Aspartyl protease n=1 Tax=Gloeothece verrucosa (strain PCC 7822) TaxID=497965 RepID=E0UGX9_GLOV7|nr:hypothetical protein [Gloeothece verrucosa]ADN14460.1 conserved hypothetical protein [Gloeothece verrucosa PCC 7822]
MINGYFGSEGELFFEIDLIAADGSIITVDALLDTGFTDWLAMNIQDAESLNWSFEGEREMKTARGTANFNLYRGSISFEGEPLNIPVLVGEDISEILIGLPWLERWRLVVDKPANLLTLGS